MLVARRLLVVVLAVAVSGGSVASAFNPLQLLGLGKTSTSRQSYRTPSNAATQPLRGTSSAKGYDGARSATGPTVSGPGYNGARSATGPTVAGNGYKGTRSATAPTVAGNGYNGARSATSPNGSHTSGYHPTKARFWK
jgi:hypothetical protein